MRPALRTASLILAALLALSCALQLCRWQILANADSPLVYRLDRLTGQVEMSLAGSNWQRILSDIQPDRFFGSKELPHTGGSANYLYADGHVDHLPASQLRQWADEGFNFALPAR